MLRYRSWALIMALRCVLWDFGDTLADERFMLIPPEGVPEWSNVWSEIVVAELAEAWYRGDISMNDVLARVAKRLYISTARAKACAQACSSRIQFYATPLGIAKRSCIPQALVTVNPDLFSEEIVPRYKLNQIFDTIVISWEERTLDKVDLSLIALKRIGGSITPSEALLIDNRRDNIDAWESQGGRGYHFRGEENFRTDLTSRLNELALSAEPDSI
jgi:hypothetical protein